MGVTEPVNFSDSAALKVVVEKFNDNVRLCADYFNGLNETLEFH